MSKKENQNIKNEQPDYDKKVEGMYDDIKKLDTRLATYFVNAAKTNDLKDAFKDCISSVIKLALTDVLLPINPDLTFINQLMKEENNAEFHPITNAMQTIPPEKLAEKQERLKNAVGYEQSTKSSKHILRKCWKII